MNTNNTVNNFPFQAVLTDLPQSSYARNNMRIGNEYTVYGWAGSCWEVSTDIPGDKTIISPTWFE